MEEHSIFQNQATSPARSSFTQWNSHRFLVPVYPVGRTTAAVCCAVSFTGIFDTLMRSSHTQWPVTGWNDSPLQLSSWRDLLLGQLELPDLCWQLLSVPETLCTWLAIQLVKVSVHLLARITNKLHDELNIPIYRWGSSSHKQVTRLNKLLRFTHASNTAHFFCLPQKLWKCIYDRIFQLPFDHPPK